MKKYFEKISRILMLFAVSFFAVFTVNAETAPSSFKMTHHDSTTPIKFPATFHVKNTTTGKFAYCTYYAKKAPVTSISYNRGKLVTDNGMNYILTKAYSARTNNDSDFFIYQTALWIYMIDKGIMPQPYYDLTVFKSRVNNGKTTTSQQIRTLVSDAKKASANDTSAPTISVDTSSAKSTYDATNDTYILSPITVNSSTDKYNVSLSNAPEGTTAKVNGNQIQIIIPNKAIKSLSFKFKINVSNSKDVYKSYYYNPSNSGYQVMAVPFKETKTASASKTLKITKKTSIDVIKLNENGEALSGAKLEVTNSNGEVVDSWTTDGNKHTVKKLSKGTYTVKETEAPAGYVLSTNTITFTVNENGTIVDSSNKTITLVEVKNEKTSVKISKQDITNKQELPNAKLVIKNASGKEVISWTSTSKPHIIRGLAAGTYTLTETIAPAGYTLSSETITFKLDSYGKLYDANGNNVSSITMYNKPEEKKICKNENGTFYGKDGKVVTEQQYKDDCLKICKNDNGTFYGKDGKIVTEQQYKDDCLKICKNENGTFYGKDGKVVTEQQYKDDCLKICKNENGTFYGKDGKVVTEQQYKDDCLKICKNDNGTFYGKDGNVVTEQQYKEQCIPTSNTIISKQDITNGKELPGATLVVKDYNGNVIDTWVSTTESHVIKDLQPGIYTLTETVAPAGYILSTETITFTVKEDYNTTKVVMYNSPDSKEVTPVPEGPTGNAEIPVENTASFKTITSSVIGTVIAAIGGVILYKASKKKKED